MRAKDAMSRVHAFGVTTFARSSVNALPIALIASAVAGEFSLLRTRIPAIIFFHLDVSYSLHIRVWRAFLVSFWKAIDSFVRTHKNNTLVSFVLAALLFEGCIYSLISNKSFDFYPLFCLLIL